MLLLARASQALLRHTAGLLAAPILAVVGLWAAIDTERTEAAIGASEIAQRASRAYSQLKSYEMRGKVTMRVKVPQGEQSLDAGLVLAAKAGGYLRDELDHPESGVLIVANGKQTWTCIRNLQQYTVKPGGAYVLGDSAGTSEARRGMAGIIIQRNIELGSAAAQAKLLREETLRRNGAAAPCWVIETPVAASANMPASTRTFWVDQKSAVVWKQHHAMTITQGTSTVERHEIIEFDRLRLDSAIADSVFVFRAPPKTRLVAEFEANTGGGPDLTGEVAADFTLRDLNGKEHKLSAHRGKVVMLDFWATWCGPCRVQMPNVEKLHHELKGKGLVVYAINQGETREKASAYLTKNKYTTTTLLDQGRTVGRDYQVNGIPTLVIIDRKGKISSHFVGVREESVLRAALEKAGL